MHEARRGAEQPASTGAIILSEVALSQMLGMAPPRAKSKKKTLAIMEKLRVCL